MTAPDEFLWEKGEGADLVVFKGSKPKLVGYVLHHPYLERSWHAQSIKGTDAWFDTQDEARDFLNFVLNTET